MRDGIDKFVERYDGLVRASDHFGGRVNDVASYGYMPHRSESEFIETHAIGQQLPNDEARQEFWLAPKSSPATERVCERLPKNGVVTKREEKNRPVRAANVDLPQVARGHF